MPVILGVSKKYDVENCFMNSSIYQCNILRHGNYILGVSKKYGVENCFMNASIYQCNILRHGNYNIYLCVCKVANQYVKGNSSYDYERNDGSTGTWMIKYACCVNLLFDSLVSFDPSIFASSYLLLCLTYGVEIS